MIIIFKGMPSLRRVLQRSKARPRGAHRGGHRAAWRQRTIVWWWWCGVRLIIAPPPAAAAASSSSSAAAVPSSGALPEVVLDQRLTKADALAIANAIHCPSRPTYVDFKRETRTLKVYTGSNGCRRCDVVVDQVSTLA